MYSGYYLRNTKRKGCGHIDKIEQYLTFPSEGNVCSLYCEWNLSVSCLNVCDVFKGLLKQWIHAPEFHSVNSSYLLFTELVYKLILVAVVVIIIFFHR